MNDVSIKDERCECLQRPEPPRLGNNSDIRANTYLSPARAAKANPTPHFTIGRYGYIATNIISRLPEFYVRGIVQCIA